MSSFSVNNIVEFKHAGYFDVIKTSLLKYDYTNIDSDAFEKTLKCLDIEYGSLFKCGDISFRLWENYIVIINGLNSILWLNKFGYVYLKLPRPAVEMCINDNGMDIFLRYRKGTNVRKRRLLVNEELEYKFIGVD